MPSIYEVDINKKNEKRFLAEVASADETALSLAYLRQLKNVTAAFLDAANLVVSHSYGGGKLPPSDFIIGYKERLPKNARQVDYGEYFLDRKERVTGIIGINAKRVTTIADERLPEFYFTARSHDGCGNRYDGLVVALGGDGENPEVSYSFDRYVNTTTPFVHAGTILGIAAVAQYAEHHPVPSLS